MIVTPKVRGFICTTAHPKGCEINVEQQVAYVEEQVKSRQSTQSETEMSGPKKVLVIGASTGYGLASRISAMVGYDADTIGVFFEKPAKGKRTASPGWYNTVAFDKVAQRLGRTSISINGDAFGQEIKALTIEAIKENFGQVDLVVYSLAAPRRVDPVTGIKYMSALKPIGDVYTNRTIDIVSGAISEAMIEPATEEEIEGTIKVMGGEDWQLWIEAMKEAGVLAKGVKTIAYSYIGPEVTQAIYRKGTIGLAKEHLEATAKSINEQLQELEGTGQVVVAKALVTQASSAIPVVPLYVAALYKIMKEKNTHEGCIEQIYRLYRDVLFSDNHSDSEQSLLDDQGRIRIDNLEMDPDTQKETLAIFEEVTQEQINERMDFESYQDEFYRLFGFHIEDIDYDQEIETELDIPSLIID